MSMNSWNTLGAFKRYLRAFFTSDPSPIFSAASGDNNWDRFDARCARYAMYSAHYENSAYDDVHTWAPEYKTANGLYRYTRGVYNPTKRLVDFWATHLMGGTIDPDCGDGKETPSCLPILTTNENLRKAIAVFWRDSQWQIKKDMLCRLGPGCGDAVLKLCDDVDDEKIRVEVLHPGTLEWADFDDEGCVTAYKIKESRLDPVFNPAKVGPAVNPDDDRKRVDYVEICHLDSETGMVHYRTFRNNAPYAWNGVTDSWSEPYGFVPLIVHAHAKMDPKAHYGWPEAHGGHAKIRNLDDLASTLHDQIRKAVRPKWFFSGMQDPAKSNRSAPRVPSESSAATANNPQAERQEMEAIYANGLGATAYPMVFQLDIQFTSMEIQNASADLERDYPELRFDRLRATGDASAKALREARKPAEAKVHAIRSGYDATLVKLNKMAVRLGGLRGYPGYERFDGSMQPNDPRLDHRIGPRSVFNMDPLDIIEEETAMLTAVQIGQTGKIPAAITLKRCGWDEAQLKELEAAQKAEQAMDLQAVAQQTEIQTNSQIEVANNAPTPAQAEPANATA